MTGWAAGQNKRWRFRIIDIGNMDIIIDESYTDGELTRELFPIDYGSTTSTQPIKLPNARDIGIEFEIRITEIANFDKIIERYYNSIVGKENGWNRYWRLENTEKGTEKGHPDYILHWLGDTSHKKKSKQVQHKENKIYIELKKNGDTLRPGQLEWVLEHCIDGHSVYLMNIETPDYAGHG